MRSLKPIKSMLIQKVKIELVNGADVWNEIAYNEPFYLSGVRLERTSQLNATDRQEKQTKTATLFVYAFNQSKDFTINDEWLNAKITDKQGQTFKVNSIKIFDELSNDNVYSWELGLL